ncbi:MAG: hypothetical protein ACYDBJ_04285 [Aggregatilineales bacterium]
MTPIPNRSDTIGVDRAGTFYLRLHNSSGFADISATFASWPVLPTEGDWTGSGFDTIGTFNTSNGLFSLCTANNTAVCAQPANVIQFTLGNPGDEPIAGRWSVGLTHDGVGVYRPSNGLIYIKNNLTTGFADYTMVYGIPGDQPVAGDWNGDGLDSPGVYRPAQGRFYLTNQVTNGPVVLSDYYLYFGYANGNYLPIAGDWTGTLGHDGVGLFQTTTGTFYLKNQLTTGFADLTFQYGLSGDTPLAGHWQLIYPPAPNPVNILVPPTSAPVPTSATAGNGGSGPGD